MRWLHAGFAVSLIPLAFLASAQAQQSPERPTPSDEQQQELLAERDRLWEAANRLVAEGKPAEAIATGERMLAIERRVLGDVDSEVTDSLEWLADGHEELGDFQAAKKRREAVLQIKTQLLGREHWQVTDARLALAHVERLSRLNPEQRRELITAKRLNGYVMQLDHAGKYRDAVAAAEHALQIRQRLLGPEHPSTATSLNNLAALYDSLHEYAKAEPLHQQSLAIRKKVLGLEHPHTATSLNNLAFLYDSLGDHARAEPLYQQSLAIRTKVLGMEHPDTISTFDNLAGLYEEVGDYAKAGPLRRQSLEIVKKVLGAEHPDTAASLEKLADLYSAMDAYAKAEPLYQQCLAIRTAALGAEHPATAASLSDLGALYVAIGAYAKAEPLYRRSLEIARKMLGTEHPDTATCLNNLAHLYHSMHEYAKAEPLYQQSLEINKKVLGVEHPATALTLGNLAGLYESMGDYARAEKLNRQSLEIREKLLGAEHPHTALSRDNLAGLYESMGDYAKAEPLYQRSLEIRRKVLGPESLATAHSLNNLGLLYYWMGDYAKAEPLYQQSLEINRRVLGAGHPDTATCLNNLASVYDAMGEHAKAEPLSQQSLEIRQKTLGAEHPDTATSLNNLALLYQSMHDYAKAEPLYRQGLDIRRKVLGPEHLDTARSLNSLAFLYDAMGDYAQAEPLYQQSLEIRRKLQGAEHPDSARCLNNLAFLYDALGDFARAEPRYREALEIARKHLEISAAVQAERQQLAMTSSLRLMLDSYLSFAVRSGQYDEAAYRQLLAWKGSVLTRQQSSRVEAERPDLKPLYDELHSVTRDLARLAFQTPDPKELQVWRGNVARLSARRERLESELSGKSAVYRAARQQVTLEDLRAILPAEAVLVDFLDFSYHANGPSRGERVWQRRLLAFVVAQKGPAKLLDLGEVAPLSEAIDAWRATFGRTAASAEAGGRLRTAIWEPIESYLSQSRVEKPDETVGQPGESNLLLVSPDGVLGRLPLAALPGRQPGTYLLEDWPLAIIPAPQALPRLLAGQGGERSEGNLLVLGDVDYDARSDAPAAKPEQGSLAGRDRAPRDEGGVLFPHLDGTRDELAAIQKTYRDACGEAGLKTLLGSRATRPAFSHEASRHRYLHLATHGFFAAPQFQSALERSGRDDRLGDTELLSRQSLSGYHPGLLSGLVLAGANKPDAGDDGILTAEEVATLDLTGVDLAVLSACETGLGPTAGGEGLLGLQRAFHAAGAHTVVASLWKVDDAATRDLMQRFYDNLWNKHMGKLAALREAQLWMLHDRRPPTPRSTNRDPRGLKPLDRQEQPSTEGRLPPYYWAAFVLSGDWR